MSKKKNILFSVIIPIYNRVSFIEKTIRSVLDQTYSNFEVICINDGSIDDSDKIISRLQLKDNRIRLISLEKNSGRCIARNKGIDKAKGDWICFLDSDDYYLNNHLEELNNLINKFSEHKVFCTSQSKNIEILENNKGEITKLNLKNFMRKNPIQINQLCIKKNLNIKFPNERLPYGEDWLFFRLISLQNEIIKTNKITNIIVEHEERSMITKNWLKFVNSNVKAGIYFANELENKKLESKILSYTYLLGMNILLSNKYKKDSVPYLKKSLLFINTYFDILLYKGLIKYFISK